MKYLMTVMIALTMMSCSTDKTCDKEESCPNGYVSQGCTCAPARPHMEIPKGGHHVNLEDFDKQTFEAAQQ